VPELPDVVAYVEAIERHAGGERLARLRLGSPFVLRSVAPAPGALEGRALRGARRLGKRIVLGFEGELFAVIHLMIAGRLRWRARGAALPGRRGLAAFDFETGTLLFTEEGSTKRASLYLVRGAAGLADHGRGGLEVLDASLEQFRARLARENRTLKRALCDPSLFSGIGNAYSDEILHAARLSPLKLTAQLSEAESARLFDATRTTLLSWIERTRTELAGAFPEKVSAFRPGMAVHGRYRQPCPACGAPVQRIVYAKNEANYCAACQTGGKLLADRALSRLLKQDWPRDLEEWAELHGGGGRTQ
jgi:formamidopyrimidine-DNA glycosylase